MFNRDSFVSRISTASTCPDGAIGVEVWGRGRDGTPNEALERLVMNVDPQHGGGCWVLVAGVRQDLPDPPTRCLGSAASTVDELQAIYRAAAARYPLAPFWSPRWDCDALVASMFLSGFNHRDVGQLRLAQLDALDSSADAAAIDQRIRDTARATVERGNWIWPQYAMAFGSDAPAEAPRSLGHSSVLSTTAVEIAASWLRHGRRKGPNHLLFGSRRQVAGPPARRRIGFAVVPPSVPRHLIDAVDAPGRRRGLGSQPTSPQAWGSSSRSRRRRRSAAWRIHALELLEQVDLPTPGGHERAIGSGLSQRA